MIVQIILFYTKQLQFNINKYIIFIYNLKKTHKAKNSYIIKKIYKKIYIKKLEQSHNY